MPTITCTSSNVVQTVLETFAGSPDAHVWFGPDTYMGQNLRRCSRARGARRRPIAAVHPRTRARRCGVLPRFHYFEQGNCIVHHMFGAEVVERVREDYPDAHVTAHLEVPGEMFALASRPSGAAAGWSAVDVDILDHIAKQVRGRRSRAGRPRLQFVLGTEAGMITSIVARGPRRCCASGRR
jgi:quinolinate synthase